MSRFHQRFSIYSSDPKIAFPLVELSFKRQDVIDGIKNGTFDPALVSGAVKNFAESIQAAIKEAKANGTTKGMGDGNRNPQGAEAPSGAIIPSGSGARA